METPGPVSPGPSAGESSRRDASVARTCRRPECGRTFAPGRPSQVYCSARCRTQAWDARFPRVTPANEKRQREGSIGKALLAVMDDGLFRTVQQLAEAVGALPASVSARIRELRAKGHHILRDHRRGDASEAHRYRLVTKETAA